MADKRDYYEVLGVDKNATEDQIKKAYRQKAKQYHPDLNPGDKTAEAKMKEVNEAYEVLSDADKKAKYDQFGHAGVDPNFGAGGFNGGGFSGFDFGDLGDIFGSFFGGGASSRYSSANAPRRGGDIEASVTVSFEEAAKGCKKEVTYHRIENCPECGGSGAAKGTTARSCPDCGGSGHVRVQQRTPLGVMTTQRVCSRCSGKGKIVDTPCSVCSGKGKVRKKHVEMMDIPAGIDDRQAFSKRGMGDIGTNGGSNGDLHVVVNVRPHPLFERDGFDVWCEIPLTYTQAALGAEITVPTLDGKVSYRVHEGTQPGDVFKFTGKGIQNINGRGRGNHYVRVTIEVPKGLTDKQKSILREFDSSMSEKNYQKRKGFFDKIKDSFK
ncbi:MAG: molecular chaperone DnaJ [Clostridia bacterium]|nr:molecular chaperone DnaJ [Clostridia bacterium]